MARWVPIAGGDDGTAGPCAATARSAARTPKIGTMARSGGTFAAESERVSVALGSRTVVVTAGLDHDNPFDTMIGVRVTVLDPQTGGVM